MTLQPSVRKQTTKSFSSKRENRTITSSINHIAAPPTNGNILHLTFSSSHIKKNEQSQFFFQIKNKARVHNSSLRLDFKKMR